MRPRPCFPWLVLVFLSCCLVAPTAQAAITLTGTVSDSLGATLPGISVTLTDGATNEKRATTTDAKGAFQFNTVEPGRYCIEVAAAGFSTLQQAVNVLPSQDAIKLALVLHLLTERGATATAARPPNTPLKRASPQRRGDCAYRAPRCQSHAACRSGPAASCFRPARNRSRHRSCSSRQHVARSRPRPHHDGRRQLHRS